MAGLEVDSSEGTFFVPTDEAFYELPEGALEKILADPVILRDFLLYHVADGSVLFDHMKNGGDLKTLHPREECLSLAAAKVNGAAIIFPDLVASNGVVHVIDSLLIPGTTFDCDDSTAWHLQGDPDKDCAWVDQSPPARCELIGNDSSLATYACPLACGTRCGDSTTWSHAEDTSTSFPSCRKQLTSFVISRQELRLGLHGPSHALQDQRRRSPPSLRSLPRRVRLHLLRSDNLEIPSSFFFLQSFKVNYFVLLHNNENSSYIPLSLLATGKKDHEKASGRSVPISSLASQKFPPPCLLRALHSSVLLLMNCFHSYFARLLTDDFDTRSLARTIK